MFIAILTLLSALSISGVAIFYSVIGLATIFPGAFIPVVIMGGVLEVGKLITASWLYRNWKFTTPAVPPDTMSMLCSLHVAFEITSAAPVVVPAITFPAELPIV